VHIEVCSLFIYIHDTYLSNERPVKILASLQRFLNVFRGAAMMSKVNSE
jgi:hypothetical protein